MLSSSKCMILFKDHFSFSTLYFRLCGGDCACADSLSKQESLLFCQKH